MRHESPKTVSNTGEFFKGIFSVVTGIFGVVSTLPVQYGIGIILAIFTFASTYLTYRAAIISGQNQKIIKSVAAHESFIKGQQVLNIKQGEINQSLHEYVIKQMVINESIEKQTNNLISIIRIIK